MKGGLTSAREKALRVIGATGWARIGQGMYSCSPEEPVVTPTGASWLVDMSYAEPSAEDEKRLELTEAGLAQFHSLPAADDVDDPGDEPVESAFPEDAVGEPAEDKQPSGLVVASASLPEFEGLQPVAVVSKLNGAGQRIRRPMRLGEHVMLLVEAEVANVGHGRTDDGVKRLHTLRVDDLWEIGGPVARRFVNEVKQAWSAANDPGVLPMKVAGDKALLETLGLAEDGGAVVVVFAGGARAVHPDDFPAGMVRPMVAERLDVPGGSGEDIVTELLDHETGAVLATWDDEDDVAGVGDDQEED